MVAVGAQPVNWALLTGATVITLGAAWLAMRLSLLVQRVLGGIGVLVLARVEGLLLAALAVEFVLDGIGRFLGQLDR